MAKPVAAYVRLNEKYLREAEELLKKGEYTQASEKLWGAAAEITKALGAKLGRSLRTHSNLWKFVIELDKKHPRLGLIRDFYDASHLRSNFYEDELLPEAVLVGAKAVKDYVSKIKQLME